MSVRKVRLEVRGPDRTLAEEPAALIAHGGVCEGGGSPASAGRSSSTRTPAKPDTRMPTCRQRHSIQAMSQPLTTWPVMAA
jgi:hypothetical protein